MKRKGKKKITAKKSILTFLHYFALLAAIVFFVGPLGWELLVSFNAPEEAGRTDPKVLSKPSLRAWSYLKQADYFIFTKNSLIIVSFSVFFTVFIGSLAAFAIARFNFKSKKALSFELLTLRMVPPITVLVPIFIIFRTLKLLYTYHGLILLYVAFNLPMTIWLMAGFFRDIPHSIEECALIDGSSWFRIFWRLVLPMSAPGVVAVTILNMIFTWNEFMFALIITSAENQTLPIAASGLMNPYTINWAGLAVVSIYITIPILIFALLIQRNLVRGISLGAIKE
jgi:multiple sugar transport system permease protein